MGKSDRTTQKKRKKSSTREASATEAGADGICSDHELPAGQSHDLSDDEAALQAELKRHKQVSKSCCRDVFDTCSHLQCPRKVSIRAKMLCLGRSRSYSEVPSQGDVMHWHIQLSFLRQVAAGIPWPSSAVLGCLGGLNGL